MTKSQAVCKLDINSIKLFTTIWCTQVISITQPKFHGVCSFSFVSVLHIHDLHVITIWLIDESLVQNPKQLMLLQCEGAVASTAVKLKLRECLLNKSQRELSNISNSPPEFRQWYACLSDVAAVTERLMQHFWWSLYTIDYAISYKLHSGYQTWLPSLFAFAH